MQYVEPGTTWTEWLAANADQDEAVKLSALREHIYALAIDVHGSAGLGVGWANKKLAKLGVTERISAEHHYVLELPATGTLRMSIYASSRAEALAKIADLLDGTRSEYVSHVAASGDATFTSGPEDVSPGNDISPDAPATVPDTLAMLREVILLGHIAGPKYCEDGANKVLGQFGLAPVPPLKAFTVTRPVQAVMETTISAYDEESARKVADWRWENNRAAYSMAGGEPTGDQTVAGS